MKADHVSHAEQLREVDASHAKASHLIGADKRVVRDHVHAMRLEHFADRASSGAERNEADGRAKGAWNVGT